MLLTMCILGSVVVLAASLLIVSKKNPWCAFFALMSALLLVIFIGKQITVNFQNTLAKDVSLTQVPVSGQKNHFAQIKIIHKDGKLDSVMLVPKSTVPEAVVK